MPVGDAKAISESSKPDPGDLFRLAFDLSPSGLLAVDSAGKVLLAKPHSARELAIATASVMKLAKRPVRSPVSAVALASAGRP